MRRCPNKLQHNMLFRTICVAVCAGATAVLGVYGMMVWFALALLLLLCTIYWNVLLYRKQVKKLAFLLDCLESEESMCRFNELHHNKDLREINALLNRISLILHRAKHDAEEQEKVFEHIINNVNSGIIVINSTGHVLQSNKEALRLFGMEAFTHTRQLQRVGNGVEEAISKALPGENLQLKICNERSVLQVSAHVSHIRLHNDELRIFALYDIHHELNDKEFDAWMKLIRVLTHEIMNTITPVVSLTETLLSNDLDSRDETLRGLQTIKQTSKGLLGFVESYRKFSHIPTPTPALFYVMPFIERYITLVQHRTNCRHIRFSVRIHPADLLLYADEHLLGQVITNLLLNAIQAIGKQENGAVSINGYNEKNDTVVIEISNNGAPIPAEIAEQIFIPFFTTKKNGSGVGLSLSQHIVRQSGGTLTLMPIRKDEVTTFRIEI